MHGHVTPRLLARQQDVCSANFADVGGRLAHAWHRLVASAGATAPFLHGRPSYHPVPSFLRISLAIQL